MSEVAISQIPAHWAASQPGEPAVIFEDYSLTWEELESRTNRLARAYQEIGVSEGDFVTVALPNGLEFVESCFAIWKLGATPQPVSHRLPKIELDAIIELAQPSLVIGVEVAAPCPYLPPDFEPGQELSADPLPVRVSEVVKVITSGGSTGRPKLIVAPSPAMWDLELTYLMIPHQGRVLVPGPLYHNGPFLWAFCGLFQGNAVVIAGKFDAENTLKLIEQHQVENMYIVPTMMQRIWNLPKEIRDDYDLSSLRAMCHMAAPCPGWLKEAYIQWLGASVIWEVYGGSEQQGGTMISGDEWLLHKGSVGKPMDYCEIRVVDDAGEDLPAGEVGEIFMRPVAGPGTTYKYIGAESKELDGGWDSLGDMGYLDSDGYLYLVDRRTDMILSGGANIYPAEVEAAIDQFPGVRSSAVIGLPHEDMGNYVHAIIDAPGLVITEEEMLEFLADRLVKYKLPRELEFVSEPLRDDAGKLRRRSLREARLVER